MVDIGDRIRVKKLNESTIKINLNHFKEKVGQEGQIIMYYEPPESNFDYYFWLVKFENDRDPFPFLATELEKIV